MNKKFFFAFALVLVYFGCSNESADGEIPCSFCGYGDGGMYLSSSSSTPNTPSNVTATANSAGSITVSWSSASGATGYYIYRSTNTDGPYIQIGSSKTSPYTDISVLAGGKYYYKVAAYTYSDEITGSQSSYTSAEALPNAPTDVSATVNSTSSITINWRPVMGAAGYYIYSSTNADGTDSRMIASSTTTSYENTSLSPGTTYYYKVAAYNNSGTGSLSSYVFATTLLDASTGITATANSESSITVSWEPISNATGYYIYRSRGIDSTYSQVGTSLTTSYTNISLSSGTTYYYKVAAYNSDGTGSQSSYAFTTTLPSTPTGVTATTDSTDRITVNWSSVTGATGYYIYRSIIAGGTYSQVGTSSTASYTNTSLLSGTTYYYKVAAYNSSGTGAQSSYVSATTLPSAPTGVTTTTNSESSITVNWNSVTGATGYYIYRSRGIDSTYTQIGSSTTTSYINISVSASPMSMPLSSGTTYYYKVAAYNNSGEGTKSSYVSATTLPSTPTGVTATSDSTDRITVNWSSVTGATGYYIYRGTTAGGITKVDSSTTTSYKNTSLSSGTTYYYQIAAYNSGGTGAQSSYVSATTFPSTTTSITATANSTNNITNSITVNWSSVTGATGYYIYRSTTASSNYTQIGTSTTTSYVNTSSSSSISPGTTYYYRITAYNNSGTGFQSSSYASVTTLPNAPTNVTATANSGNSITVNWGSATGATGYYIYRSATAGGTYIQVGTSTTASYADISVSPVTTYYYKVTAYNGSGTGAQSSSYASATTLLGAPTSVTATATSANSIIVSWVYVGSGATGYYIYRSTTVDGTYSQIGTSTTTSYVNNSASLIFSPSSGTTYYYKVAAYNSNGTGTLSSYASATTPMSCPNPTVSDGSVTCGGQEYKTVNMGGQVWFAENLNYETGNSNCYNGQASYCNTYGRLYDWSTAMTACPSGWHLPSETEWNALSSYVESENGCSNCDATMLKAESGWNSCNPSANLYSCKDSYGFSALPGGYSYSTSGYSYNAGNHGYWWTSENTSLHMSYSDDFTSFPSGGGLFSVRCVQDSP